MREWPDELRDVPAVVYDFNTGEELAEGRANITFVSHTDPLRVRRHLFEGVFVPDNEATGEVLRRKLFQGLSVGAPAMSLHVEYQGDTWVFVVKFELSDLALPFSGRAEPKRL